jgi:hypothetical protein
LNHLPFIEPSHPKHKLLFFVAQDLDDSIRAQVRDFVMRLASHRSWLNGAPCFVDSIEVPEDSSRGDFPVGTLGGYLEIYSAWPPLELPREIDLQHFDEVSTLVNALCSFSGEHGLVFELELDGDFVGEVARGQMDSALANCLLGEWRKRLGVSGGETR